MDDDAIVERSLSYLTDMFGSSGTHGRSGPTIERHQIWKDSIVNGEAIKPAKPSSVEIDP